MQRSKAIGPSLIILIVVMGLAALTVNAAVTVSEFKATWQPDGSILVVWETATEIDTQAFNLYRATASAGPWGQPITQQEAEGDGFTGAAYQYRDANVVPGTVYYYQLEELTSAGAGERFGPVEAVLPGTATVTATATPTATVTPTPTATTVGATTTVTPIQSPTATWTPTSTVVVNTPAPTATQRYTNTPPPPTATVATPPTLAANVEPTATPLPPASVATPTGSAPADTPALPGASPTPEPFTTVAPSPTMTAAAGAAAATPVAPADPDATRTPLVFLAAGADVTPVSTAAPEPAADSRDTQRLLLLGGGAIGLAAILAAIVVFIARSRRQ